MFLSFSFYLYIWRKQNKKKRFWHSLQSFASFVLFLFIYSVCKFSSFFLYIKQKKIKMCEIFIFLKFSRWKFMNGVLFKYIIYIYISRFSTLDKHNQSLNFVNFFLNYILKCMIYFRSFLYSPYVNKNGRIYTLNKSH